MHCLVGIVGYYGFVRGYPLGPELMARLEALPGIELLELNWGPVAIVQDLQARATRPDRVVLVGALDRGLAAGTVQCRRWAGGAFDPGAVQRRMFEAVTGVISLDNLLVIGTQFGVWPDATFAVELQWPDSGLGDLVLDELGELGERGPSSTRAVVGEAAPTPENARAVEALADAVRRMALDDPPPDVPMLTIADLTPVATVSHHGFVDDLERPHPLS